MRKSLVFSVVSGIATGGLLRIFGLEMNDPVCWLTGVGLLISFRCIYHIAK